MRAVHKKAAPKQKAAKKQKTAPKKKCLQCDAAFGRADNLSRHVRTVLEQRFEIGLSRESSRTGPVVPVCVGAWPKCTLFLFIIGSGANYKIRFSVPLL